MIIHWVGKLPSLSPPDTIYGKIMKELCRIVLRFHRFETETVEVQLKKRFDE